MQFGDLLFFGESPKLSVPCFSVSKLPEIQYGNTKILGNLPG